MSETVQIIVLKRTKLGESDSIITGVSKDGSQVKGIAKGVRKSGSRFGATLEPFTVANVLFYSKRALPMITDAKIVTSNSQCRNELERSSAASAVAELLLRITQEGQEEPVIFDLSVAALDTIGTAPVEKTALVVAAYAFKLLAIHGYRPSLASCAVCGEQQQEYTHFSNRAGGVVCVRCCSDAPAVRTPQEIINWIAYLMTHTFAQIVDCDADSACGRELLQVANTWTTERLEGRVKSLDFCLAYLA